MCKRLVPCINYSCSQTTYYYIILCPSRFKGHLPLVYLTLNTLVQIFVDDLNNLLWKCSAFDLQAVRNDELIKGHLEGEEEEEEEEEEMRK